MVDDNRDSRFVVGRVLRSKGYDVLEAATGKEVLSRAREEWPTLIILDVMLPDVSGTEVFQTLRSDPITKMIPVLLVTARPDIVSKLPTFEQSRDRYLEKTGHLDDLVRTVHEMVVGPKAKPHA